MSTVSERDAILGKGDVVKNHRLVWPLVAVVALALMLVAAGPGLTQQCPADGTCSAKVSEAGSCQNAKVSAEKCQKKCASNAKKCAEECKEKCSAAAHMCSESCAKECSSAGAKCSTAAKCGADCSKACSAAAHKCSESCAKTCASAAKKCVSACSGSCPKATQACSGPGGNSSTSECGATICGPRCREMCRDGSAYSCGKTSCRLYGIRCGHSRRVMRACGGSAMSCRKACCSGGTAKRVMIKCTEKSMCGQDCQKPCCAGNKDVKRAEKSMCGQDCKKPCCAGDKDVKRAKKSMCGQDCKKPCCAGDNVSEANVGVSDGDHLWVSNNAPAKVMFCGAANGVEDLYVVRSAVGTDYDADDAVKKMRITSDGETIHLEELDSDDEDSFLWTSDGDGGAWLGVYLQDLTPDLREAFDLPENLQGALVADVVRSGPARRAGIREGFVIVEYDGNRVENSEELIELVNMSEPGDKVEIVLNRKGSEIVRRITLGKKPQERVIINRRPGIKVYKWDGDDEDDDIHIEIPDIDVDIPDIEIEGLHDRLYAMQHGAYLGVSIEDNDDQGVVVREVYDDTPAEEYGIEEGDVIYEIDGEKVEDTDELIGAIRSREPGDEVAIYLERDGDPLKINVELGRRDSPLTFRMVTPRSSETRAERLEKEIQELQQELKDLKRKLAKLRENE